MLLELAVAAVAATSSQPDLLMADAHVAAKQSGRRTVQFFTETQPQIRYRCHRVDTARVTCQVRARTDHIGLAYTLRLRAADAVSMWVVASRPRLIKPLSPGLHGTVLPAAGQRSAGD